MKDESQDNKADKIIAESKLLEDYEFSLLPRDLQRDIVLLKFFDLRFIMDIKQNFGTKPVDDGLKKKMTKKAKEAIRSKTFGWAGFASAFNHLITWSTVFAPDRTNMIAKHFSNCQDFYERGDWVGNIAKFSDEIRLQSQGAKANWNDQELVTKCYRLFLEQPKKRRSLLHEGDSSQSRANFRGRGREGFRGRSKGPRDNEGRSKGPQKICWNFTSGGHCPFGADCRYIHSVAPQNREERYGRGGGAKRGRGGGRATASANYPYYSYDVPQSRKDSKSNKENNRSRTERRYERT